MATKCIAIDKSTTTNNNNNDSDSDSQTDHMVSAAQKPVLNISRHTALCAVSMVLKSFILSVMIASVVRLIELRMQSTILYYLFSLSFDIRSNRFLSRTVFVIFEWNFTYLHHRIVHCGWMFVFFLDSFNTNCSHRIKTKRFSFSQGVPWVNHVKREKEREN